jgi:hypothetical protein
MGEVAVGAVFESLSRAIRVTVMTALMMRTRPTPAASRISGRRFRVGGDGG